MPSKDDTNWKNESVSHFEDMIYDCNSIGDNPDRMQALTAEITELYDWDEQRKQLEVSSFLCKET